MTTYNKKGKVVTKQIKNNKTVTLGQYGYEWIFYDGGFDRSLFAITTFAITYKDGYSGETKTTYYTVYSRPKN